MCVCVSCVVIDVTSRVVQKKQEELAAQVCVCVCVCVLCALTRMPRQGPSLEELIEVERQKIGSVRVRRPARRASC